MTGSSETLSMQKLQQDVRQFIIDNFLFGQQSDQLSNEDSFLDSGIIDSTGVLELVGFLETTYGVVVDDHELVPANLDSVVQVARFVEQKLQAKGAGATA
jgi:acyl carrier protein